jgi:MFS transporter, DHA2 family, multidrug resistance protein
VSSAAAIPASSAHLGASRKWLITIAVMLGATLEILDTSIVNVALPHLQGSFSASTDEITWVLTSYIVANGIMIPLTGWISSRFGRRRYFLTSVVLFVVASAACGAAQSLSQIVTFRIVQGFAGAAMIPSSQAILMETFPAEEQGLAMAMWGVGLMVAPLLGPTLGGWITDNWTWRWNFYINLPTGLIAAVMVWMFVEDPEYLRKARSAARRVDVLGIACLVVGLGLLQIVLDRGQRADWFAAPWVCAFTAISVIALAVLFVHELRFPDPILDLSILRIPTFNISVLIISVMVLVVYGANLLNPLFFQNLLGYSAWRAGLALTPRGAGTLIAMLGVAQLTRKRIDTRWLVSVGFGIFAVSLWSMSRWTLGVGSPEVMLPIFFSGFAGGLIFPTMSASTLACVERERMGYAASLYNMMRNTGSAIGISVVSNLLVSRSQIHQAYLGQHFTTYQAWQMSHPGQTLPGAPHWNLVDGLVTHQLQGFGMVYHTIQQQAALMAYNDIYRLLACVAALFIPTFIFLRKPPASGAPAGH